MSVLVDRMPTWARTHLAALRALLVLTVILGVFYPLAVFGIGQLAFASQANGSPLHYDGRVAGSAIVGQNFTDAHGNPLPQWFQPRPSAAGKDGYDPLASGASNLGPNNPALVELVQQRRQQVATFNGVPRSEVPADAVTASGSGLDPDISPAYARLQVARVAKARGLNPALVDRLVTAHVDGRPLGILGEPHVNVVTLNAALSRLRP